MKKDATIEEIVTDFLQNNKYRYLTEDSFEKECVAYGLEHFDKLHRGSSYSRLFRKVRNEIDLKVKEVQSIDGIKPRWKTWIVIDKTPQFSLFAEVS